MIQYKINNIDMLEPIRLGFADIIYQGEEGLIFIETRSQTLMISIDDLHVFKRLCQEYHLEKYSLFDVRQKEIAEYLVNAYGKNLEMVCYNAVYRHKEIKNMDFSKIKVLTMKHLSRVCQVYKVLDQDYMRERIQNQCLWGLFVHDELAGFVGIHSEGAMGMLEVFGEYRRKGYGLLLECFLINEYLRRGWVPYCQVVVDNEESLSLQRKMGLSISTECSYWLYE